MINWCIQRNGEGLEQKWLVRVERTGSYREIVSDVHNHLLRDCTSINAAINEVSASHDRPIPYHPINIVINEEYDRIQHYTPKHNDWEDHTDIPTLVKIASEIRLVTIIVIEQEKPSGESLNKARCSLLKNSKFVSSSKKHHDVAEQLTSMTGVKPIRLLITEQHDGVRSTQKLSARETLNFLKTHASRMHKKKDTLTVYRLHLNKEFAHDANKVICAEILTEKQYINSKPWWSSNGYVFMPNAFFRFVFFTSGAQPEACPLERLFLEQYFTVPCETGFYDATCPKNVSHIFSRMAPLVDGEETIIAKLELPQNILQPAAILDKDYVHASMGIRPEGNIAVFDFRMFYPFVMSVSAKSNAYSSRVLHMANVRSIVPSMKRVYTKELGVVGLVRKPLYNRMIALSRTILGTLIDACRGSGIEVLMTQTDSVTVHVPLPVMEANGGSMNNLAFLLQQKVRNYHPTFLSELTLEREGTHMLVYSANKHILYDGEKVVHHTGFHCKTFCPAMSRTIQDLTSKRSKMVQLLCSPTSCTDLPILISKKMRENVLDKTDIVCDSYSLNPLLVQVLHVQPGEDGMFATMPTIYLALSKYRSDNEHTMPTFKSFMNALKMSTVTGIHNEHFQKTKRVVETIFTENMGIINWKKVIEEIIQYYEMKTVAFLKDGAFV